MKCKQKERLRKAGDTEVIYWEQEICGEKNTEVNEQKQENGDKMK